MDDRTIMENLLNSVKGTCDLMMHGSIESATPTVHSTFNTALNECLSIQNQVYAKMSAKGWYTSTPVEQQKVDSAKQKFANG